MVGVSDRQIGNAAALLWQSKKKNPMILSMAALESGGYRTIPTTRPVKEVKTKTNPQISATFLYFSNPVWILGNCLVFAAMTATTFLMPVSIPDESIVIPSWFFSAFIGALVIELIYVLILSPIYYTTVESWAYLVTYTPWYLAAGTFHVFWRFAYLGANDGIALTFMIFEYLMLLGLNIGVDILYPPPRQWHEYFFAKCGISLHAGFTACTLISFASHLAGSTETTAALLIILLVVEGILLIAPVWGGRPDPAELVPLITFFVSIWTDPLSAGMGNVRVIGLVGFSVSIVYLFASIILRFFPWQTWFRGAGQSPMESPSASRELRR